MRFGRLAIPDSRVGCIARRIDVTNVVAGHISPVYLLDAAVEVGLLATLAGGLVVSARDDEPRRSKPTEARAAV